MQIRKTVWTLYILGVVITESKGKEQGNVRIHFADQNSSDYDSNYQDYTDRDYPDIDYHDDDRDGRSLDDGKIDDSSDDESFNEVEKFMMKQLMSTIPGTPGVDYALYQTVPDTSFRCERQKSPGFYGDVEAQCQVFHICQEDDRHDSFLCPLGTVFNQISFICDWWFNFNCEDTPTYYHLNNKFDSATGHTSMRETMKKMKNFQDKHDMNMVIGLAKVHKKYQSMQNMMKQKGQVRRAMSPKIRNLFMIKMRKNRLGRIRNTVPSKRDVHELVTTSTLPVVSTPLEFQTENSTEYHDAILSEYTTLNSEFLDINNEPAILNNTENLNSTYNTTDISSEILPFDISVISLKSLLNMSGVDMVINGSILAAMKVDSIIVTNLETNTNADPQNATINTGNYTDETLSSLKANKSSEENEHFERIAKLEKTAEIPTKVNVSQTSFGNNTKITLNSAKFVEPSFLSMSKPFSHENNFIIGNDTHISVSVTIHSNSGHSKLQWKRIPGLKRIRKVRFKNEDENSVSQQYPVNDTIYRKRNNEEKPKSRVMWIPAMKNSLNRKLDWKTFLQFVKRGTVATSTIEPEHIQSIENIRKESLKSSFISSVSIRQNTDREALKNNVIPLTDFSTSTVVTSTIEPKLVQSLENTKREFLKKNTMPSTNIIHGSVTTSTIRPESLDNIKAEALKSNDIPPMNIVHSTVVTETIESNYTQTLQDIGVEALKRDINPPTNTKNMSFDADGKKTEEFNQKLLLKLILNDELVKESNNTLTQQKTTKELVLTPVEENTEHFNLTDIDSEAGTEIYTEIQTNPNRYQSLESGDSCRTICIKLFKSLNINSTQISENATHFEKVPSSLTSFDSAHIKTQVKGNYGRKSVLGTSPSEQWTVKYDPGPDCNENTENDKILVKGWSVIVDAGEVTKEKTVKRRRCANTLNENKSVLKGNYNTYATLKDRSLTFDGETFHQPLYPQSNFVSNDQRYWLNLVKNWLEQSPNKREENKAIRKTKHQKEFLLNQQMPDDLSNRNQNYPEYYINTNQDPNDNKRRPQLTEQNSRLYSFSNLQTEKSDWSRTTHKAKDLSINKRDLTEREQSHSKLDNGNKNEDLSTEHVSREIIPDHKSNLNQNFWLSETREFRRDSNVDDDLESRQSGETKPFTDDDYEDLPSKEITFANDMAENRQSDDLQVNVDRQDWSSEKGIQDDWDSESPQDFWDRKRSSTWSENTKKPVVKDKNVDTWPKSGPTFGDWSTENRKTQDSDSNKFAEIWKTDSDPKNADEKQSRSAIGSKGRSVGDDWNWSQNKGYDEDQRNDRPAKQPRDIRWSNNKGLQNRDDWMLREQRNKPDLSTGSRNMKSHSSREDKKDWFSDEDISWRKDTDSEWREENPKNEKDWKKSAGEDKGNKMPGRPDWHSSEEYWNSKGRGDTKRNENGWHNRNTKGSDIIPDWFSNSNDKSDWSSEFTDDQQNVFADHHEDLPTWPPQKGPSSMEGDNVWNSQSKSFKGEMRPSNHAKHHNNNRRISNSPSKGRTSPKPWNSNNQSTWKGTGIRTPDVPENQPPRKHTRNGSTKPRIENPHRRSDFPGSKGKNKPPDQSWDAKGSDSFPELPKNEGDRTNTKKMDSNRPSDLWPRRTQNAKGEDRRSKQPRGKNNRNTPNREKGTKSWADDKPSHGTSKGNRRGSSKSTNNNGSSWGPQKNSKGNNRPQPSHGTSKGNRRGSFKSTNNNGSSWGPQKNSKGNNRPQQSSSPKGNTHNRSKNSWQNYVAMNNSNKSKGDTEAKKNMWSLQIGSDGKLGNGWIPITIRPNLKARRSDAPNDWNEESKGSEDKRWKNDDGLPNEEWTNRGGSSKAGDFINERDVSDRSEWIDKRSRTTNNKENSPSNPSIMKGNDWSISSFDANKNSKDPRKADLDEKPFSLTTEETISNTTPEIITSTAQKPEASFNQLFYIPAYNSRYRRSNKNRDKRLQMRETKKPYKIIKSGEILSDSLKHSNKFFLARAGIIVQNDNSSTEQPNRKQTVKGLYETNFKSAKNTRYGFNISKHNENLETYRDNPVDDYNNRREIWPKETIIVEKWSPYISPNFSVSGWMPVTTFKPSKNKDFTGMRLSNRNDRMSNDTPFYVDKAKSELDVDSYTHVLSDIFTKDASKELKPDLPHSTVHILSNDENRKNGNETRTKESTKVVEMKDGNKTLRVLSFSNVMKQFQRNNHPNQNSSDLEAQENTWNVPITTHPKTYSLKLIDFSNENKRNMSNSWTFNSKENGTKKAWILVVDSDTTEHSSVNENVQAKEQKENFNSKHTDVYKVFNGSKIIPEDKEKDEVKVNDYAPQSKFANWNENSDWTPIIRTVGRVVSFNRTLTASKKDNNT